MNALDMLFRLGLWVGSWGSAILCVSIAGSAWMRVGGHRGSGGVFVGGLAGGCLVLLGIFFCGFAVLAVAKRRKSD